MIENILFAVMWFAILGAVMGLLLAIASKVFFVKTEEKVAEISELLQYFENTDSENRNFEELECYFKDLTDSFSFQENLYFSGNLISTLPSSAV